MASMLVRQQIRTSAFEPMATGRATEHQVFISLYRTEISVTAGISQIFPGFQDSLFKH